MTTSQHGIGDGFGHELVALAIALVSLPLERVEIRPELRCFLRCRKPFLAIRLRSSIGDLEESIPNLGIGAASVEILRAKNDSFDQRSSKCPVHHLTISTAAVTFTGSVWVQLLQG